MRKLRLKAPASLLVDYFRLFVSRRAYTLQAEWPYPESGRHYYFRPSDKKTGQGLSLPAETLRGHIEGEITIALYTIDPATQRCEWVVTRLVGVRRGTGVPSGRLLGCCSAINAREVMATSLVSILSIS